MTEQRTPWYSGYVNPERIGWYECKLDGIRGVFRLHWNGHQWRYDPLKTEGLDFGSAFGKWPRDRWRGLVQPC